VANVAFVLALISAQSCCQATLARFFDNFEAASRRLTRLLHNSRLSPDESARSHARALCARLPARGAVRLALDWTTEETQHLLVASLRVGGRALPLYWRAYHDAELAERIVATGALETTRARALEFVARAKSILPTLPDRQRAALDLIEQGVARPRWAEHLGAVTSGDCYLNSDAYGDRDEVVCVFSYAGQEQHALVVDTSRSRLFVYANDLGRPRYITDFYISLGKNGIDKQREGDQKTPIGVYTVLAGLGILPAVALVAAAMAVVQVQNACDPTKTQNGCVANCTGCL